MKRFVFCSRLQLVSRFSQKVRPRPLGPGPSLKNDATYPGPPCWSCEQVFNERNHLFCNGCQKLQPAVEEQDYFALLGLKPRLILDKEVLERSYQALQKKVHPDLFVGKSSQEQAIARARSAAAGEAYMVLRDSIARSKYVLAMHGVDLERAHVDDPELLEEVMCEQENMMTLSAEEMRRKVEVFQEGVERALREADELLLYHGDTALGPVTHLVIRAQYYDKLMSDYSRLLSSSSSNVA